MTILIISPDFVSHYNPLSVLAAAAASTEARVVVATGQGLRGRVEHEGHEWRHLQLSAGSNTGVVIHDPAIDNFLAATSAGPVATIRYQAEQRERDLLWEPERIISEIGLILDQLNPEHIIVDHVSFNSTLGVYASGRPFTTVVPGHPSQLPVGGERYGIPTRWPAAMTPTSSDIDSMNRLADRVARAFTERWNNALEASGSTAPPVDDAFSVHGQRVLYNSVAELADPARAELMPVGGHFVGPLVRSEDLGSKYRDQPQYHSWSQRLGGRPQVYVGLGTFLSRRADVLGRIAEGLRLADVRAAIALGPTPLDVLGPIPDDWITGPSLPQVALLTAADLAIHHGGNNSVQESLAFGCRQLTLPFSTDQFANAADLERAGWSTTVDPNVTGAEDIAAAIKQSLAHPAPTAIVAPTEAHLAETIFGGHVVPRVVEDGFSNPSR